MTDIYDLIAIGSGPAGESAAELAAIFGHRSAVIEKARRRCSVCQVMVASGRQPDQMSDDEIRQILSEVNKNQRLFTQFT